MISELNKEYGLLNFDLNKVMNECIEEQRKIWRDQDAKLEEYLKKADNLANGDPYQGIGYLFAVAKDTRRLHRRFLRSRFGYKVEPLLEERARNRFITTERKPNTGRENAVFAARLGEWMGWEAVFTVMDHDIMKAPRLDKDTFQLVRETFSYSLRVVEIAQICYLLLESYQKGRLSNALSGEGWMQYFSGWVGAQIAAKRYPTLRYALEKEGHSCSTKFHEELGGTTLIELDNLVQAKEMPPNLVNRVSNHLSNAGSGTSEMCRDNRRTDSDPADVVVDEPLLQEFLAKEALKAAYTSRMITKGEYEVLELTRQGYTEERIADVRGTKVGGVKKLKHRGREKLKQASGL